MIKITLSVLDRLQLPTLLIKTGSMIEMELTISVKELIRFTPKEIDEYELKDLPGGKVSWDPVKAKDKEYEFHPSQVRAIQEGIKQVDAVKGITENNYSVAKKFQEVKP